MAVAVSRAIELGAPALVAPSAGNAGGALAAYGAAGGVPVTVVMPEDVPAVNRDEALAAGARVLLHDGLIDACGVVARRLAAEEGELRPLDARASRTASRARRRWGSSWPRTSAGGCRT